MDLENIKDDDPTVWKVFVATGDLLGAGTDCNVSIELFGDEDTHQKFELNQKTSIKEVTKRKHFEKGTHDRFLLKMKEPLKGSLKKVVIELDNASKIAAKWYLARVILENSGQLHQIVAEQWIDHGQRMEFPIGNLIHVFVIEARDLLIEDPYNLPHPYCRIQYGKQKFFTHHIPNTTNPMWARSLTKL